MQYSILGPFSREETESLIPFIDIDYWLGELGVMLEVAGLQALSYVESGYLECNSHHGNFLTVIYKDKKLIMCNVIDDFCAYYVGESKQVEQLKTGFSLFFDTLENVDINLDGRLKHGLEENDAIRFIEDIYSGQREFEEASHRYKAINHLGIDYDNGYLEMETKVAKKVAEMLKELPFVQEYFRSINPIEKTS